jgi:hypothetical protein
LGGNKARQTGTQQNQRENTPGEGTHARIPPRSLVISEEPRASGLGITVQ